MRFRTREGGTSSLAPSVILSTFPKPPQKPHFPEDKYMTQWVADVDKFTLPPDMYFSSTIHYFAGGPYLKFGDTVTPRETATLLAVEGLIRDLPRTPVHDIPEFPPQSQCGCR